MGMKLGAAIAAGVVLIALAECGLASTIIVSGGASTFTVGGDEHWRFGFNYTDWANKTAPFYVNDTLVFKYDPPNSTTFPHSVYLLKGKGSFKTCSLIKAKLIGNETQGGGEGLKVVLKKRVKPYFFACGERAGVHCKIGLMRFAVYPLNSCRG